MNRNLLVAILLSLAFVAYFHEYVFLGRDAHIRVHDNLDSDVIYRHLLVKEKAIFMGPLTPIRHVMNGLPRVCLPSGLNLMVWLYGIFGTFGGFVASEFLAHALAYLGVCILLKNRFLKEDRHFWLRHLAALLFATMPFFPVTGGAVALQPLLLNSFMNIRSSGRIRWKDFIPIVAYPLYSSLVWVGMFVLIFLFGASVCSLLTSGPRGSLAFVAAVALLAVFSVIADHQLIMMLLNPSGFFINHRVNFQVAVEFNAKGVLAMGAFNAMNGIYHSANYAGFIFAMAPLVVFARKGIRKEPIFRDKRMFLLGGLFFFLGVLTTVWFWKGLGFLYAPGSLFTQVNFSRFHYLLPLTGFVLLIHSCLQLDQRKARYLLVAMMVAGVVWHFKLYHDLHHFRGDPGTLSDVSNLQTYRQFFSEGLFRKVKGDCDRIAGNQNYNVVGLGIRPSVLQYNDFNTLDGYQNLYPLSYEKAFMGIIARELEKCPDIKERPIFKIHSMCYLYSCELFRKETDDDGNRIMAIHQLLLDPGAIRRLNGSFLISIYKVEDFGTDRIREVAHYRSPDDDPYPGAYLYQVL